LIDEALRRIIREQAKAHDVVGAINTMSHVEQVQIRIRALCDVVVVITESAKREELSKLEVEVANLEGQADRLFMGETPEVVNHAQSAAAHTFAAALVQRNEVKMALRIARAIGPAEDRSMALIDIATSIDKGSIELYQYGQLCAVGMYRASDDDDNW
jgi:hypothetical protein